MVIYALDILICCMRIELAVIAQVNDIGNLVLVLQSVDAAVCDVRKVSCTEKNILLK